MKQINQDFSTAKIGDILYSDFSFTPHHYFDEKRDPIGIISHINKKEKQLLITALRDSTYPLMWSENYIAGHSFSQIVRAGECSIAGEQNTQKIVNNGRELEMKTPAALFCYRYTTKGTQPTDWFLPDVGELDLVNNNHKIINKALERCGAEKAEKIDEDTPLWCSSEYSYAVAKIYQITSPSYIRLLCAANKSMLFFCRPMMYIQANL